MLLGNGQFNIASTLMSASEPLGKENVVRIQQTIDGSIDLAQLMQSLASVVPVADKQGQALSSITGGVDFFGSTQFRFSPGRGKLVRGDGELTAAVNIGLPQSLTKGGAPSQIDIALNLKFGIARIAVGPSPEIGRGISCRKVARHSTGQADGGVRGS
jgi:hypothetical protein